MPARERPGWRTPVAVQRAEQLNAEIHAARETQQPATTPSQQVQVVVEAGGQLPIASAQQQASAQQLPIAGAEAAQARTEAEPPQAISGVKRGLATLAQQRGGTLQMRLDPPSLGTVRMEVAMSEGRVRVQIHAANESARALLSGHLDVLRTALEEGGLAVERLAVDSATRTTTENPGRGEGRGDTQDGHQREDREHGKQDASQGRHGHQGDGHPHQAGEESPGSFQAVLEDA